MAKKWATFHQQEDLTTRLHNILEEYPPGIGIFKEFLQNADDAGARRFAIVFDATAHPTEPEGLLAASMAAWQGPALYVYNDAKFSDGDFESISHVGRSGKHDDTSKIGKYGLGFNCAYHFTDVVSFVTGENLVIFDPHGQNLPDGELGLRSNFIDEQLPKHYPAQFAPFMWAEGELDFCECSASEQFPGTLFRLPLRTKEQASASAIAATYFEQDELLELLHEFEGAAASMLLFLRNVEEISIHIRHPGVGTRKLGAVRIGESSGPGAPASSFLSHDQREELRRARSHAVDAPTAGGDGPAMLEQMTYELQIDRFSRDPGAGSAESPLTQSVDSRWLLHWHWQDTGGSGDQIAAIAEGLRLSQWVAVAVPLPLSRQKSVCRGVVGKAYCFLPLPIETGLHVHLNAAFALSSNRRDLWQAGDASGTGALKASWNSFLLQHALPAAYAAALHQLGQHISGPNADSLASALPDLGQIRAPFDMLAAQVLHHIVSMQCPVFWDSHGNEWIAPDEAVLEDPKFQKHCRDPLLRKLVMSGGLRLVSPPSFLLEGMKKAGVDGVNVLTPVLVGDAMRGSKAKLNRHQSSSLLMYLLDGYKNNGQCFKNLLGLRVASLLPRSSGKLGTFQARTNCSQFIYLCPKIGSSDASKMLPSFEWFLDPESAAFEALSSQTSLSRLNIAKFGVRALASNMEHFLPSAWCAKDAVPMLADGTADLDKMTPGLRPTGEGKRGGKPSRKSGKTNSLSTSFANGGTGNIIERVQLFWQFLDTCGERVDFKAFGQYPTVLAVTGSNEAGDAPSQYLLSIDNAIRNGVVCRSNYSKEQMYVLSRFGCWFLHDSANDRLVQLLNGSGQRGNLAPALRSVAINCSRQHSSPPPEDCELLRALVLSWISGEGAGKRERKWSEPGAVDTGMLRSLPIFETLGGKWISADARPGTSYQGYIGAPCVAPSKAWASMVGGAFSWAPVLQTNGDAGELLKVVNCQPCTEEHYLGLVVHFVREETCPVGVNIAFLEGVERCSRVESIWKRKQERGCRAIIDALETAPLVVCEDGRRRMISETMDPSDPELQKIFGTGSAAKYPIDAYAGCLKVMRKAGMCSLSDGEAFVQAMRAVTQTNNVAGARVLLHFLTTLQSSQTKLNWSNEHYTAVSREAWVPAQDWRDSPLLETFDQGEHNGRTTGTPPSKEPSAEDAPVHMVELPRDVIRQRITQIYSEFQANKLEDVDRLMTKYKRKEIKLYAAVCQKYGVSESFFDDAASEDDAEDDDENFDDVRESDADADTTPNTGSADDRDLDTARPWQLVSLDSPCCMRQDAALGWPELMLLDRMADGIVASLASRLRLQHPVASEVVARTLLHIGSTFGSQLHKLDDDSLSRCRLVIETCCTTLAKAVKKGSRTTSGKLQQLLADAPFILTADGAFVKPRHLCFDLDMDLGLRARAVPDYLVHTRPLLMLLGAPAAYDKPRGSPQVSILTQHPTSGRVMIEAIRAQFNMPALSDIHFKILGEDDPIYGHRLILSFAGSRYFTQLFMGPMAMSGPLPLVIGMPDWASRGSVLLALNHIYTGKPIDDHHATGWNAELDNTTAESIEEVLGLLRLADMMDLAYAKEWCEVWLAGSAIIDLWNTCVLLEHAHNCHAQQLVDLALFHIQKMFKFVENTEEWHNLDDELQKLVYRPQNDGESDED
jgi:hypothetical protein